MKTIMLCGLLLASLMSLNGCQKSENEVKPAETPITSFVTSETALKANTVTSGPWELGITFSPSVAGKITQVGSRMFDPGNYRVTLWDNDTKQILRQKTIAQTAPNALTMVDIEPLPVAVSKKLTLSINSQSDGVNKKVVLLYKEGQPDFMPFAKGNILFYNTSYRQTATALFPEQTIIVKSALYGLPELTFLAD